MNKMLVTVFDTEEAAFNALSALKDLHRDGDITLYSHVVIEKDTAGKISLKSNSDNNDNNTITGLAIGSLIGLIGGPAGLLVGATSGTLAGMLVDLNSAGVDAVFVDNVSEAMLNGSVAVIANVEEEWNAPVDTKMLELNGVVFRELRNEVENDQILREVEETDAEIAKLKKSLSSASDDMSKQIKTNLDTMKKKLTILNDRGSKKVKSLNQDLKEKTTLLDTQIQDANDSNKIRLEKQKSELLDSYAQHNKKIESALKTIQSGLNQEI